MQFDAIQAIEVSSVNPKSLILRLTDIRAVANRYAAQLQKCCPQSSTSYPLAKKIHAHMICSGFRARGHLLNRLIDIYCKSQNLVYAHHLFDKISEPDVVSRTTLIAAYSAAGNPKHARFIFDKTPVEIRDTVFYNSMITCYAHNCDGHAALQLFREMKWKCFKPDYYTLTSVLGALAQIVDFETQCQQLHCEVIKSGTGLVTSVVNALISVYVKCACSPFSSLDILMDAAKKLFDDMVVRDEMTWTTLISGYVRNNDLIGARKVFDEMNVKIVDAWNCMISGYVHRGMISEGLNMFRKMRLLGIKYDEYTYTSTLSACADSRMFLNGKEIHAYIIRNSIKPSLDFLLSVYNALITLYWKCGKMDEARKIFDKMAVRDIVSWNAMLSSYVSAGRINEAESFFREMPDKNLLTWTVMISGFSQNGFGEEGLRLFNQMRLNKFQPCDYAFAGAITCCAVLAALEHGRQLHSLIIRSGFESSLSTGNSLITMYARCGVVESANRVFQTMPFLDSVSWNAIIAAFGQHGHGVKALEIYEQMLKQGILPDRITFLTVLSACSHAGLVEKGRKYFDTMQSLYNITPKEDHYARLIDLLGRAGKLSEAKEVIDKMPFEPSACIWEALLGSCRIHGNMDLGIEAAEHLFEVTPQQDGTYILLSNMYANVGRWDDVAKVRKLMRDRGVKKEPGVSWIEVENKVHVFTVNDTKHPEVQQVYDYIKELGLKMKKLGYIPDTKYVLHDMEFEHKEIALSTHSEKIAVVYGLLKLPKGAVIRVFKNLRICGDCHNAFKFISKLEEREIVVRDGKRFHHFKDGECSCGNYW